MTDHPAQSAPRRKRTRRVIVGLAVITSLAVIIHFLRNQGLTPLCRARTGQEAQSLIDRGVRINARDKWENRTPLHYANGEVAEVLKEHGGTQ